MGEPREPSHCRAQHRHPDVRRELPGRGDEPGVGRARVRLGVRLPDARLLRGRRRLSGASRPRWRRLRSPPRRDRWRPRGGPAPAAAGDAAGPGLRRREQRHEGARLQHAPAAARRARAQGRRERARQADAEDQARPVPLRKGKRHQWGGEEHPAVARLRKHARTGRSAAADTCVAEGHGWPARRVRDAGQPRPGPGATDAGRERVQLPRFLGRHHHRQGRGGSRLGGGELSSGHLRRFRGRSLAGHHRDGRRLHPGLLPGRSGDTAGAQRQLRLPYRPGPALPRVCAQLLGVRPGLRAGEDAGAPAQARPQRPMLPPGLQPASRLWRLGRGRRLRRGERLGLRCCHRRRSLQARGGCSRPLLWRAAAQGEVPGHAELLLRPPGSGPAHGRQGRGDGGGLPHGMQEEDGAADEGPGESEHLLRPQLPGGPPAVAEGSHPPRGDGRDHELGQGRRCRLGPGRSHRACPGTAC
mmetsp:Transcript_13270/g.41041  ORF Transcript_13270/g.41041 Transcript_13270/m.41041 type:complete len:471 (+) Transcript_13270:931-2343(+)